MWSVPGGKRLRTIDFGVPSFWQVGPGRLFAQTPEGTPIESFAGGGLLRSWRLPDGEPEVLGHVDARKLGITSSFFEPHGRAWLYTKGTTVHTVPLPVDLGADRVFSRHGANVELGGFLGPDLLALHDASGENRILRFPENGPPVTTVIQKPGSAPAEVARNILRPIPSGRPVGRREAAALGHDRPPGSAAPGAATGGFLGSIWPRPRPRGSHCCGVDSFREPADFLAGASALAQRRRLAQAVSPLCLQPRQPMAGHGHELWGKTNPSLASTWHRFQRDQDARPAPRSAPGRDVGHGVRPTGPLLDCRKIWRGQHLDRPPRRLPASKALGGLE